MTTVTFDTHDFVKKLKGVGFSEEQAEALTDLQKTIVSNILEQARHHYKQSDLATKRDLLEATNDIKADLNLHFECVNRELKLNRWILGLILVSSLLVMLKIFFE